MSVVKAYGRSTSPARGMKTPFNPNLLDRTFLPKPLNPKSQTQHVKPLNPKTCSFNLTLGIKIAQKPYMVWSLGPKALIYESLDPEGYTP